MSKLPEGPMKTALEAQSPEFAAEIEGMFANASEADRADMLAFFECDGPRRVDEQKLKNADGTPTANDLAKWLGS